MSREDADWESCGHEGFVSFMGKLDTPIVCDCTTSYTKSQDLYDEGIAGIRVVSANPHFMPTFTRTSSRQRFFDSRAVLYNVLPLERMLQDLSSAGDRGASSCAFGCRWHQRDQQPPCIWASYQLYRDRHRHFNCRERAVDGVPCTQPWHETHITTEHVKVADDVYALGKASANAAAASLPVRHHQVVVKIDSEKARLPYLSIT